jgi:NAD(P)-dependent dehydrogenase (short-subunit alcohol dehydrogenase family)
VKKRVLPIFLLVSLTLATAIQPVIAEPSPSSKQKAVLVTGASSGIGLRITEHLTAQGHFVYAGARKDADIERLNAMENVQAIRLDVNDHEQITAAVGTISEAGRGLHGLVNNAGVGVLWPLIEIPESEFDFQMQVNLYGPYRVTRAFAPLIIENKGRISTIGSISGILSGTLFGPYSMSKHAMEAFADSLAREMDKFAVKVSIVEPGNFQSDIGQNLYQRLQQVDPDLEQSRYREEMQRLIESLKDSGENPQADPIAVARAVEHALFAEQPKMRYMVVPNAQQAEITIRKAMEEMLQLNHDHAYSYDRARLIEMLDEELVKLTPAQAE